MKIRPTTLVIKCQCTDIVGKGVELGKVIDLHVQWIFGNGVIMTVPPHDFEHPSLCFY
jgi:hypothetical protein